MDKISLFIAMVKDLGLSSESVLRLEKTAPHQYRHYTIPKRNGGSRDIYHPTPLLKDVQRWLLKSYMAQLPVHNAVHSYVSGRSILTHASCHISSNFLLKLDFKNFFPSIGSDCVERYLSACADQGLIDLAADARSMVVRLLCRFSEADKSLALSIGAPSSPAISNSILYELDDVVYRMAASLNVVYTRYADDIYFSSVRPNVLAEVEGHFRAEVQRLTPWLSINEEKTVNNSRKRRRVITGLVVTPQRRVSIGRDRKRYIKSMVHKYLEGRLALGEPTELAGHISYVKGVEPDFLEALRRKFGAPVIDALLCHQFEELDPEISF